MNSGKLNDWLQVVGMFAVVVSLIFVGLQMRQTQVIADATLYQMRADASREISAIVVENDKARAALRKLTLEGYDSLDADEQTLVIFTFNTVLNHFESSHYLYTKGLLSQEQWDSDVRQLQGTWRGTDIKRLWTEKRRASYRESFAREIDKVIN